MDGAVPSFSRKSAAEEAGMSKDQQVTAIRIRSRAMRRAGELAKQIMQPNHRPSSDKYDGGDILISKAKVQEVSGFSERQPRGRHRPAGFRWPELHALGVLIRTSFWPFSEIAQKKLYA